MVHSLCRAGTASAALLNGNQQANPASGSADDKGNSATDGVQRNLQKRTGDKQANERASALKKMSVQESPVESRISPNRHYTFALRHKKAMHQPRGSKRLKA